MEKRPRGRQTLTFIDQVIDDNRIRENRLGRAMETNNGRKGVVRGVNLKTISFIDTYGQRNKQTQGVPKNPQPRSTSKFGQISKHFHFCTLTFTNSLD